MSTIQLNIDSNVSRLHLTIQSSRVLHDEKQKFGNYIKIFTAITSQNWAKQDQKLEVQLKDWQLHPASYARRKRLQCE